MLAAALPLSACATGSQNVPDGLSPEELIQRAQEASDRNRFNHALQLYGAVLDRFPGNLEAAIAAEYEIAFIHYRRRNFGEARAGLNAVLGRYDAPDGEFLPEKFSILATIVLERIDEREAAPWWRR